MIKQSYTQRTVLLLMVLAVAFLWTADQGIRAATGGRADTVAAPAVSTSVSATATTAAAAAPAGSPQGRQRNKPTTTACTVNGHTFNPCPPGLLKQANRQAARKAAAKQRTGVSAQIAGVSPATSTISPLAAVGAGPSALALTNFGPPDYFGVANWMNSPLPTVNAGVVTGGMLKFVDGLPGLGSGNANNLGNYIPLAVADTTTYPGSDFYHIGLQQYSQVFHSAFNATGGSLVRGYFDLGNTADPNPHYLGPIILATRNVPTRVLFSNQITADLNIPVDTTYMGAGLVSDGTNSGMASSKRSTIHLHGGNSPWISDGTPHTWVTPAGGDGQVAAEGFAKGFSFMNVPDMVPPGCAGAQCAISAPSLTDGLATYYWTNQQSGRFMFYHDHAYGITRLNVYAGEAAGYLIVDPAQESALASWGVPGTILTNSATGALVTADLTHLVPMVIQDKTFVPDKGGAGTQSAATDPTWDFANWGGYGSLWFPHVYSPNQNPSDITGANPFGRYDWGPWFWPPQVASSLLLPAYPCTSVAYPGGLGVAFPPLMCPGVPDPSQPAPANAPSSTPEAFMDTPVVNGTAYPNLVVAPAAYRFHLLNAANDRTWNLGLYVAEPVTLSAVITAPGGNFTAPTVTVSGCTGGTAVATVGSGTFGGVAYTNGIIDITMTSQPSACASTSPTFIISDTGVGTGATAVAVMSQNTEVKMVPAVPATSGRVLPNCAVSSALTLNGGGQVTTTLTTATGLPASCWPLYTSPNGFTAGTFGERGILSWGNSDARVGGVPDPLTAGPPIIQIGAEGGLLPQVAVIPSTPISYDYNKRSITVLNVLNHGLLVGGAERAEFIVDFSQFAGQTLILYNDAPAPVPGNDPRLDYYTNDPDQSSSGGAPSTLAGYGPNTRTIMRIQVTGSNPNTTPFSLATLTSNLPALFATTQEQVIVPESVYPAANGNGPSNYVRIQDTSLNLGSAGLTGLTLTASGSGYTSAPTVAITAPATGVTATATANLAPVAVASLALTSVGTGYTSAPNVVFTGTGTGASATAALATTGVASVSLSSGGSYTAVPAVGFTGGTGSGAVATATLTPSSVASVTLNNAGTGYTSVPAVTVSGGGGTGATAIATMSAGGVASLTLTAGGSGYTSLPTVGFTGGGGGGSGASATARLAVNTVTLTAGGSRYTSAPRVTFTGGGGTGAAAIAALAPAAVGSLTLSAAGSGYTSAPTVVFNNGGGTGARATATVQRGRITRLTLNSGGSGYTSAPTISFTGGGAGTGAAASATLASRSVASITVTAAGSGYTGRPTVGFTGGGGSGARATAVMKVGSLTLTAGGTNYTSAPAVTITGGGGTGAGATATVSASGLSGVTVTTPGSGYTSAPTVAFSGGGGSGAIATAVLSPSPLAGVTVSTPGSGYTSAPTVTFTGGLGSGAVATAALQPAAIASLTLNSGGSGYTTAPLVSFSGGTGSGAAATATLKPSTVASLTLTNVGSGYNTPPAVFFSGGGGTGAGATAVLGAVQTMALQPKAIQELFTLDYGRMNATLGVEVPFTNFLTQTTIPYGFVDPPTEIFKDGETQIWKITHNGVDTHVVHFHLFTVQVINRVGWDGSIKPPDPNEVGLKDTVRMNPLEDVIVALRPLKQTLPFAVPSSWRPMDPTKPIGFTSTTEFTNIDPNNNPATVTNTKINFGWEYVWHCHILGHEENDFMRVMILAVAPSVPSAVAATGTAAGTITLSLSTAANTPNVADPTGFSIYRGTATGGPFTLVGNVSATITAGSTTATGTFTDSGLTTGTTYYYQVVANNLVGYTQTYTPGVGYPNTSADSAPSATVSAVAK